MSGGEPGYRLDVLSSEAPNGVSLTLMGSGGMGGFDVQAVDATFGTPIPVVDAITSLMVDGSLASITSDGNRKAAFVISTDASSGSLAAAEVTLLTALNAATALVWYAPGEPTSYFDIVNCWTDNDFDPVDEIINRQRLFRGVFECLPYARSKDPVTFVWTAPYIRVHDLASITGWTFSGGTASSQTELTPPNQKYLKKTAAGSLTFQYTFTAGNYIRLLTPGAVGDSARVTTVTIDGVAVSAGAIWLQKPAGGFHAYTIDTRALAGRSITLSFNVNPATGGSGSAELWGIHTIDYPGINASRSPRNLGVVPVVGTARATCTITFTAPTGGAFVYTAPDPNIALRDNGAAEATFGKFTVPAGNGAEISAGVQLMWFPPGNHTANVGITDPQPLALNPNGVWPVTGLGGTTWAGTTSPSRWGYPVDPKAAISFFSTTGVKNLVSASPSVPSGYHGDADAHEEHVLHPGMSGFGVYDINGDPVSTTVTYYPRGRHNAPQ